VIAIASLALATIAFVGSHLAMSHPLRLRLVQNLGERYFLIVYSAVSAVTLLWMILAYRSVRNSDPLWIAPSWWWPVASGIMLVATILLIGSLVRNPAFPHPGAGKQAIPPAAGVFAVTRHPMNWSFILWSLVHISLWGSPRNLIVASGILVLATAGSIGQDRKKLSLLGPAWRGWMDRTSFIPFAAILARKVKLRAAAPGWRVLVGGLLLWLAITIWHAPSASVVALLSLGRA
jgi:uncharacterized membrane protein